MKKVDVQHSREGRRSFDCRLTAFTPSPISLVYHTYFHEKHGQPLPEGTSDTWPIATDEQFDWVFRLLKENWCPITEFPTFSFRAVVPRALHDQVRAHRHGSYFSESHQLYEPSEFAKENDYMPLDDMSLGNRLIYRMYMIECQRVYNRLRYEGVLPALARGVLPLHINLGISFTWNLRTMFFIAVERRCHILQGTYWNPFLENMKQEIVSKVDARMGAFFELQPCDISGRCISPIEEDLRLEGKDPHAVCPRYLELKRSEGRSTCCGLQCLGCLSSARSRGVPVERSIKA